MDQKFEELVVRQLVFPPRRDPTVRGSRIDDRRRRCRRASSRLRLLLRHLVPTKFTVFLYTQLASRRRLSDRVRQSGPDRVSLKVPLTVVSTPSLRRFRRTSLPRITRFAAYLPRACVEAAGAPDWRNFVPR